MLNIYLLIRDIKRVSSRLFVVSIGDKGHLLNNKRIMFASEGDLKLGLKFVVGHSDIGLANVLFKRRRGGAASHLTNDLAVLGSDFCAVSGWGPINDEARSLVLDALLKVLLNSLKAEEAALLLPSL